MPPKKGISMAVRKRRILELTFGLVGPVASALAVSSPPASPLSCLRFLKLISRILLKVEISSSTGGMQQAAASSAAVPKSSRSGAGMTKTSLAASRRSGESGVPFGTHTRPQEGLSS